jgi:mannosyltransferase OCH1-like enzyme
MYARGGVYADADAECMKPITSWWIPSECDAVVGLENNEAVCQWAFASVPHHPLFARAIAMIVERVRTYQARWGSGVPLAAHSNEHFVHFFTGPGLFTDAVKAEFGLDALPPPGTHSLVLSS